MSKGQFIPKSKINIFPLIVFIISLANKHYSSASSNELKNKHKHFVHEKRQTSMTHISKTWQLIPKQAKWINSTTGRWKVCIFDFLFTLPVLLSGCQYVNYFDCLYAKMSYIYVNLTNGTPSDRCTERGSPFSDQQKCSFLIASRKLWNEGSQHDDVYKSGATGYVKSEGKHEQSERNNVNWVASCITAPAALMICFPLTVGHTHRLVVNTPF